MRDVKVDIPLTDYRTFISENTKSEKNHLMEQTSHTVVGPTVLFKHDHNQNNQDRCRIALLPHYLIVQVKYLQIEGIG